jgi:thiamine biosynthesis protein ThiS
MTNEMTQHHGDTTTFTMNGKPRQAPAGTTVAELIDQLKLPWRTVAVERNRILVPRAQQAECVLANGDEIEIVTLVGGG